ncbi:replication protein A 70 kDa DNA-binding subunit A-like isoform X2 [Arachis hypogaea]|uniref:replication protein A 70 kDa DNA-binding subunit A-like isoform X2 n=1 Tax=Arachis hypogaea TaxID=3818 RepID=UPI0007887DBB|nr:replication protein A 70 kDa DNA-binding subunit C-like isoform X2 [Arachis hypogaea]XP_025608799.1 replication protein A 70 kDa DNA-binding subunit C-like isoform X2 [Arachis hypogaea]XP_025693201.1 replication protein A 70 kDa DNA-binding subunit C-like isoform X2 [Arachis hypogaea]XP_025693267.1 replication protein A 70 kDa DNA-binding subunit C-like isoform X2 [Arachis hypogaea]XP_025700189.1 replication protein A 70 kDa DNA-binding subunit C-like isoform X2 [Arachis hypogaea]XP_0257014
MAESFDLLMDVSPKKLAWNFLVHVVRLWKAPCRYNPKEINSIEMVLQDSQGGRIQASVPKALVRRWNDNIDEFKMYKMSNFIVVDKREKTKTSMNRWTLNFSHRTVVLLVENPTFPLQAFRLTQISELLNADRINDSQLIDIMGEVVGKEDPKELITSKGKETKRLAILVEDLDNYRIGCVLFGDMVDQILPYLDDGRVEPLIVVLQFFRPSRWNEKTSVQSHFDISKLRINPDLEEVRDFRDRRLAAIPSNLVRISQVNTNNSHSGADELKRGDVTVNTIEEALNSTQEGPLWIAGTIVAINSGKDDWFYKSCRKCPKKVETPIGNRYECGKCGHTHGSASLRFKVEVMAYDGTGSITLLLWDRETVQLCGRQAEQIKDEEELYAEGYPAALESLLERKLLFKVNVKSSNIKLYDQVYTVMKVCEDDTIFEMHLPNKTFSTVTEYLQYGCRIPGAVTRWICQQLWLISTILVILNILWMLWRIVLQASSAKLQPKQLPWF